MKTFFAIIGLMVILIVAVWIGTLVEFKENPLKKCCFECRAAFSRSPVGVGPAGVSCGAFPTAEPISDECAAVFARRPMTVAECAS